MHTHCLTSEYVPTHFTSSKVVHFTNIINCGDNCEVQMRGNLFPTYRKLLANKTEHKGLLSIFLFWIQTYWTISTGAPDRTEGILLDLCLSHTRTLSSSHGPASACSSGGTQWTPFKGKYFMELISSRHEALAWNLSKGCNYLHSADKKSPRPITLSTWTGLNLAWKHSGLAYYGNTDTLV